MENYSNSLWENMNIKDSFFNYAFLSEIKMKKIKLNNVNFSNADFLKLL